MERLTLSEILSNMRVENLRTLTHHLGVETRATSRYVLAQKLRRHLSRRKVIREQWQFLSKDAKALWSLLDAMGGWSTLNRLGQMLLLLGVAEQNGDVRVGERSLTEILDELHRSGLVLPYHPSYLLDFYDGVGGMWLIAKETHDQLHGMGEDALASWLTQPTTYEREEAGDALAFQRDLLLLWGTIWRTPFPLLKSRNLGVRTLRRLEGVLRSTEPTYVELLRYVLAELSLLYEVDNVLYANLPANGRLSPFWTFPLSKRAFLVRKSLEALNAPERLPQNTLTEGTLFVYAGRDYLPRALDRLAKRVLSQQGREWTVGHAWLWFLQDVPDLFAYSKADLTERRIPATGDMEIASIYLLLKLLQWLGVVDLLYRGEQVVGFRASAWARCAWEGKGCEEPSGGQVVVQPSFQVLAMGPVPLAHMALLELVAERVKVEPMVVEYTLTRTAFLRAIQQGVAGGYVLEQIRKICAQSIPQNVWRSLEEWLAEMERVQVYEEGTLLEITTPEAQAEVASFAGQIPIVALEEGRFLVPASAEQKILQHLAAQGYGHRVVKSPEEALPESISVEGKERIWVKQVPPNVFVEGVLRRIAEPVDGRTWVVRAEKVQKSARTIPVRSIVQVLKKMNGGKLPNDLQKQLYLWGARLGRVRASRVVLFRFPNQESLELFLRLLRPRRLLHPLVPEQGLAIAWEKDAEKVLQQLKNLEVEVEMEG